MDKIIGALARERHYRWEHPFSEEAERYNSGADCAFLFMDNRRPQVSGNRPLSESYHMRKRSGDYIRH